MLAGGTALRFVNLAALPDGLQQDEASIGYEAYCLANFGIDRNGYHWPVYPITWGSGGGSPLMIYCNVLTTKLFGSCVTSIRMVPAFFGSLTLVLFFCLLLRLYGRKTALAGLAILSLTPWHLMLSRWSLDSNTAPFFELIAVSVFLLAAEKKKTSLYAAAAALSALCLYSYGSANIVIPLWLLFSCVYCIRRKRLTPSQLLIRSEFSGPSGDQHRIHFVSEVYLEPFRVCFSSAEPGLSGSRTAEHKRPVSYADFRT